jgi:alanine racemase
LSRLTHIYCDWAALRHNLARARSLAPNSRALAVIKANGYGHGIIAVARALPDADAFAVASIEEAISLREAGIRQPIVLLEGFFEANELPLLVDYQLQTVIHCDAQLAYLKEARIAPLVVWLKINTGMNRLGFRAAEVTAVLEVLSTCPQVAKPIHVMTHFACADERENPMSQAQLRCFDKLCAALPNPQSIANSAGILAWPDSHRDWIRPGIMLYGASPFADKTAPDDGLRAVMQFRSQLIRINQCQAGDTVGYGASWHCPEDMLLGVVAAGYGDGYPRHAPAGTPVMVNGKPVPLAGRVSMDMLTVDLRSQPEAKIGDPVLLWGSGLAVETVATHAGTIGYELLTRITSRVKRL